MSNKQRIKATINGKDYTMISSFSQNHMQAVTAILNKELKQIKEKLPNLSTEDAAILLAINATSKQLAESLKKAPEELIEPPSELDVTQPIEQSVGVNRRLITDSDQMLQAIQAKNKIAGQQIRAKERR
ncbi:cell division protein ZapA [Atopobacter phocae]|uniref:cell division protein ZapA n=1 Tax=Atopobacter phocae TaxID=136492 RepID=UPI00046EFA3C|nr:cell division protein ZapA [Atopobacter phocae]